jgi:hypothetical protein
LLASGPERWLVLPPATRFFPRFDEPDGATVDPRETPRPDWLGVRTRQASQQRVTSAVRDSKPGLASAEEPAPPTLPVVVRIAISTELPQGSGSRGPIANVAAVERSPKALVLEYADDPAAAGRPRQPGDGTAPPGQRTRSGPIRYGPDLVFPAAYYGASAPLTPVPRTREVWPGAGAGTGPARPTLLARVWRRLRTVAAGGRDCTPTSAPSAADPAAPSTGGEARDLAEQGEGVQRIALDGLDKSAER